jgi:hypothetical protein
MRTKGIFILILIVGKLFSYNFLSTAQSENNQISAFVNYDVESERLDDIIESQSRTIKRLLRKRLEINEGAESLINEITSSPSTAIQELESIFNESKLYEVLNCPDVNFIKNSSLSDAHNRLLLLQQGYGVVFKKLIEIESQSPIERPYLTSLKRGMDSMDIYLVNGHSGRLSATLYYQNDSVTVKELPINVGEITGKVEIKVPNPNNGRNSWYRSIF